MKRKQWGIYNPSLREWFRDADWKVITWRTQRAALAFLRNHPNGGPDRYVEEVATGFSRALQETRGTVAR